MENDKENTHKQSHNEGGIERKSEEQISCLYDSSDVGTGDVCDGK